VAGHVRTLRNSMAVTGADAGRRRQATRDGRRHKAESTGSATPRTPGTETRWLRRALVESAKAASPSKDTYLAARHGRIARRAARLIGYVGDVTPVSTRAIR
jgi:hypothetical protein